MMAKFVADLHLHSAYARATSRNLNFDTLSEWAKYKGISLLSSADFTHPVWWEETKKKLKESESSGFYEYGGAHYVLGTEISCIYSQGGKVRRIHCLLYFSEKSGVEKFNEALGKIGNLKADGRPIVGLSAKQLLEMALQVNEKTIFIPAHAWTPWFSLYGSNSGFDSIDEAFGDLAKYIYAIETGLSSDPAMNWRIPELDGRSIVSFSDAHSAPKMSRELTVFDSDFSYDGLLAALKSQSAVLGDQQSNSSPKRFRDESQNALSERGKRGLPVETLAHEVVAEREAIYKLDQAHSQKSRESKVAFTLEFFPEEGKYHFTGHRNCNVRHSPSETAKAGMICPKCRRRLTIGVMHRVEQLADKNRPEGFTPGNRPKYKNLVPLIEIISEAVGSPVTSPKVIEEYKKLVNYFDSEMNILMKAPLSDLEKQASVHRIVEGVRKVREGDIVIEPGYDGVFGVVKIWPSEAGIPSSEKPKQIVKQAEGQVGFFD
ncbi:MAG: endonuclease Q family protein [Candidatus Woykebacteria bacterium]